MAGDNWPRLDFSVAPRRFCFVASDDQRYSFDAIVNRCQVGWEYGEAVQTVWLTVIGRIDMRPTDDTIDTEEKEPVMASLSSYNIKPSVTVSNGAAGYINPSFHEETPVNESCPICGAPRVGHETIQRTTKKGVSKTYETHEYECGTMKTTGDVTRDLGDAPRVLIACAKIGWR